MTSSEQYKSAIASWMNVDSSRVFLYWKGRVALFALLKSMGVKPNDEVIIPAFTCVVVPNAILYLGAKPIYVDIDPKVLNTTVDLISQAITQKTKCIIIQNTFGLSHQVKEITALAQSKGIYTIEDCTHGFGGKYEGKANGTYCDAAFFSTQWNKPFSTGIGGFSVVNNPILLPAISEINKLLESPSLKQQLLLGMLIRFRKWFINDYTYWFLLKFYRYLSKSGWIVGSSTDDELTGIVKPIAYFKGSSRVQEKSGLKMLNRLNYELALRKKNGFIYQEFLEKNQKWCYPKEVLENHSFLKYPIFVKDRPSFLKKAETAKIQLGDWFISPIHPIEDNFSLWALDEKAFPLSLEKSVHILNLPTDSKNCEKVIQFLQRNLDDLI